MRKQPHLHILDLEALHIEVVQPQERDGVCYLKACGRA
jgi:hypothetical protein